MSEANTEAVQQTVEATETSQLVAEIKARIAALDALFEESLQGEMDSLKVCLIANPSAAALLMDEDVGTLVANLRRTVSVALQEATDNKKPRGKTAAKKLTKEEIEAAFEAEGF